MGATTFVPLSLATSASGESQIIPLQEKNRFLPYSSLFQWFRGSFWQSGVDNFSLPPAQQNDMFEELINVMPVMQGTLQRRWGYSLFNSGSVPWAHLYQYQNDVASFRKVVATARAQPPIGYNEDGTYYATLFNPGTGSGAPRACNSRSYAYFVDGLSSDLWKWNGGKNWLQQALNFQGSKWSTTNTVVNSNGPVIGFYNSYELVISSGTYPGIRQYINVPNPANHTWTFSVQLRTKTGTASNVLIEVRDSNLTFDAIYNIPTLTTTFQSFSVSGTSTSNSQNPINVSIATTGGAADIYAIYPQLETGGTVTSTEGFPNFVGLPWQNYGMGLRDPLVSAWGITAPVTAVSVGAPIGSGSISLTEGRNYFAVFRNDITSHCSGLNPVSASTGPLSAQNIPLSGIPVSLDPQVTDVVVLATADGGDQTTLYQLADLANGTTTLTDDIPETTLVLNEIFQDTDTSGILHGVQDNTPPPNGTVPTKHLGRLYMISGELLYYSKNIDECTTASGLIAGHYEEAWPATYYMDISQHAEQARGLLSNGQTLYIGTEKHVRQLTGDGPTTFAVPQIVFPNVGLLSQDVWNNIFVEGQPVGCMWLTPDFRVISSDFNTYKDVGTPIQTILNSINNTIDSSGYPVALSVARSAYMSNEAFDLWLLAIPTGSSTSCDTVLVYNLRTYKWFVWAPTDTISAMLFYTTQAGTPLWLLGTQSGPLYYWDHTTFQDRTGNTPVSFSVTARTSWQDFNDPSMRKSLNDITVYTGDPSNLQVSVDAAQLETDFQSPISLVSGQTLTQDQLGDWKIFTAAIASYYRWYRFTFYDPPSTVQQFLTAINSEVAPDFRH